MRYLVAMLASDLLSDTWGTGSLLIDVAFIVIVGAMLLIAWFGSDLSNTDPANKAGEGCARPPRVD